MYKVDIQPDTKEATAIEARRNQEKQRQSRIFNTRYRTMGVDVEGLKSQVEERKLRENAEKQRDEAFDAHRIQYDKIAQMLEDEEQQRKRQLHKALVEFHQQEQEPATRREWDLQDPAALRKGQPARVSDDDPRCGPASMQCFAGEDMNGAARQKLLKEKNRRDLEEQRAEREKALADRKYAVLMFFADTLEDKKRIELDLRALELARLEEECRRAKAMAVADFNRAQAAECVEQQRLAQQREQDNNYTEIYNHLTGDILTENPDMARSLVGPHRMVPYLWKGMSPEQVEAVRRTQKEQCKENQRLREEERQREAEWDRQRHLAARAGMVMEEEVQNFHLQLRKSQDAYNQELAEAQKAHLQHLEKEVYTNTPTAQYHLQFNTSTR
ncbi:RIB43A-like with coiled-coils protein 1 isoform X1 [Sphaerodactylus townsendi]|uniref:RIB43A-like with coiled-coils protein 1 isoform X1 n=1 Tax=Sphaerodactylus townsendi TaxID=933632 RepID=UPI002025C07B|nr:RIB43A-like with coiled-coils protein 1 isoform X1 [Sphaerodactylus townsendi]XP_048344560.1 RIB43A-like with coiled-coils protein 1 isoform X1 [Sphaerodactylus townsendi]